jgi:hypothetical protein
LRPNITIPPHSHELERLADFKIVIDGSIICKGYELTEGDWLCVPSGRSYTFAAGDKGAVLIRGWPWHRGHRRAPLKHGDVTSPPPCCMLRRWFRPRTAIMALVQIVTEPRERIDDYLVRRRVGSGRWANFVAFGLLAADASLLGGVVFNERTANEVLFHIATDNATIAVRYGFLSTVLVYPWVCLRTREAVALIRSDNLPASRFAKKIGFRLEGVVPDPSGRGDTGICVSDAAQLAKQWRDPGKRLLNALALSQLQPTASSLLRQLCPPAVRSPWRMGVRGSLYGSSPINATCRLGKNTNPFLVVHLHGSAPKAQRNFQTRRL